MARRAALALVALALAAARPVPFGISERIPVERIRGPVLAVGAGNDFAWESKRFVDEFASHRDGRDGDVTLQYTDAGHLVGAAIPFLPHGDQGALGGLVEVDAAARADLWPRLVRFLGGT